jgi:hypothetical protein
MHAHGNLPPRLAGGREAEKLCRHRLEGPAVALGAAEDERALHAGHGRQRDRSSSQRGDADGLELQVEERDPGSKRGPDDPTLTNRTWVLITESPEGGWGIAGHANTGADIVQAARKTLAGG